MLLLLVLGIAATALGLLSKTPPGTTLRAAEIVQEKDGQNAGDISFARVAGVIVALALASLFIVTVFWAHHALFCNGMLAEAKELWVIYLYGTALFAPYAFNRLSQIGPKQPPK